MFTDFLKLFKFSKTEEDPKTTTFNIDRFLNDNWDKLDNWLKSFAQTVVKSVCGVKPDSGGNVTLPSASTSKQGIVQLSSSTSSTSTTTAATSSAVKAAKDAADKAQSTANSKPSQSDINSAVDPVHAFGVNPDMAGMFNQWGAVWGNYGNRYNAPFADHYYIGVDSDSKLRIGTQLNQTATITWSTIADYATEVGTSGIWHYRKWKSGRVDLWGTYHYSGLNATYNHYSGFYYPKDTINISFPFKLLWVDFCTVDGGATDYMCFTRISSWTESMVKVWIAGCEAGFTNTSGKLYLHVIGQCAS